MKSKRYLEASIASTLLEILSKERVRNGLTAVQLRNLFLILFASCFTIRSGILVYNFIDLIATINLVLDGQQKYPIYLNQLTK